jgi:hypothetical protein
LPTELEVGQERVSGCHGGDPAVVEGQVVEDEPEQLVALAGVGLLPPEPGEVGQCCGGLFDVADDRWLNRGKLGLKVPFVRVVLLAAVVPEQVEVLGPFELPLDRSAPGAFPVAARSGLRPVTVTSAGS